MPTPRPKKAREPSYRHHKPSGQAFVQLKGKRYYLGKHGTPESLERYNRFKAQHCQVKVPLPPAPRVAGDLSIITLVDRYWQHAQAHYVKHGEPTGAAENQRPALRRLLELYGSTVAGEFGPLALKALRNTWIDDGNSLKTVNDKASVIRGVFKWGVSEQLVPVTVHAALETVNDLRRGRGLARETAPIGPVTDEAIAATLPHLPAIVADMVKFQRWTGCRPQEVRLLRVRELIRLDRPEQPLPLFEPKDRHVPAARELDIWELWPARHKTEHHGRRRVVFIPRPAQEILRPHLLRLAFQPEAYVFTTATGKPYGKDEYIRAIRRGCEAAFNMPRRLRDRALSQAATRIRKAQRSGGADVTGLAAELQTLRQEAAKWRAENVWEPNRLRHSFATHLRRLAGAEATQILLGHKKLSTTEIYAERDLDKARSIMRQLG